MKLWLKRIAQILLILACNVLFHIVHGFLQILLSGWNIMRYGYDAELVYDLNLCGFTILLIVLYGLQRIAMVRMCKSFDRTVRSAASIIYIILGFECYRFLFNIEIPHFICVLLIVYLVYMMWLLVSDLIMSDKDKIIKGGEVAKCAKSETSIAK